jgi:hypothetical protein
MNKYNQILDNLYKEELEEGCVPPSSKLEYVGGHVFNFTTYHGELDIIFAKRMIEVLDSIVNRTTFDYIEKSQWHYENYITMCNMPFLFDKLEWGSSIRGAWLDEYGYANQKQPRVYEIGCTNLVIPIKDITKFCVDLLEWVKEEH